MAHHIVATSVPRGLDGVSGYQTVLKSKGIPPRVFDRLKSRAGYSHPYSHGDPRNPVVYLHRIEELAGTRWHVLGCIRDAGSDYTGRSNFLAHMLAIEADEARGKPGGPAAAAMAGGCFLTKWIGPPDGTALPKTLVVGDSPPIPGGLSAWKAAELDPGLAGNLAAAAMDNRKVVLVTRPGDDVLALFAEALRLVEPSKRWGVTFNTCAMEDFDGTWKAIRKDLVDAHQVSTGQAAVIDLTAGANGSEDPYAQFARGEATSLPWQKSSRTLGATQSDSVGATPRELADRRADITDSRDTPLLSPAAGSSRLRQRARRTRYAEEEPSHVPWNAITTAGLLVLVGGILAVVSFRGQLFGDLQPANPRASDLERESHDEIVLPPSAGLVQRSVAASTEQMGTDASLRTASDLLATKRADVRQQLEHGTYGSAHTQVRDLQASVNDMRASYGPEWQAIVTNNGAHKDPSPDVNHLLHAFDNLTDVLSDVDEVLGSRIVASLDELNEKIAALTAATEGLTAAVTGLDGLQAKVRDLEEALQAKRTQTKREQAFAEFTELSTAVSLPAVNKQEEIDLGSFPIADLIDPKVRLAVPRDLDAGDSIEIVEAPAGPPAAWEIRFQPGYVDVDGNAAQPQVLASLSASNGRLLLSPADIESRLSSLLRRCVLLVEAKSPKSPESSAVLQEIRLLKPMPVGPIVIDPFQTSQRIFDLPAPAGIPHRIESPRGSGSTIRVKLPLQSVRFEAVLHREEKVLGEEIASSFGENAAEAGREGIATLERELFHFHSELYPALDLMVVAHIQLNLAHSTLTVHTELKGRDKASFDMRTVREVFVTNPDKEFKRLDTLHKKKVDYITAFKADYALRHTDKIMSWFKEGNILSSGSMKPMEDHDTRLKSFELFLKEQYDLAKSNEDQKPEKDRMPVNIPITFENFRIRCFNAAGACSPKDDTPWQTEFVDRIKAWDDWFWPRFEHHWHEHLRMFRGAAGERYEFRVSSIASLAFDTNGTVYEVPLVVPDDSAPPVDGEDSQGDSESFGVE